MLCQRGRLDQNATSQTDKHEPTPTSLMSHPIPHFHTTPSHCPHYPSTPPPHPSHTQHPLTLASNPPPTPHSPHTHLQPSTHRTPTSHPPHTHPTIPMSAMSFSTRFRTTRSPGCPDHKGVWWDPPLPPRATVTLAPILSKSNSSWPCSSTMTVPGGTGIVTSAPLLPCEPVELQTMLEGLHHMLHVTSTLNTARCESQFTCAGGSVDDHILCLVSHLLLMRVYPCRMEGSVESQPH